MVRSRRLTKLGAAGPVGRRRLRRSWPLLVICLLPCLVGCGLAAAPCRIASAGLDIIPVAGHALATPTNGCAAVIDP